MTKRIMLCLLLLLPLLMLAQEKKDMGPPPLLQIIREEVKVGKGAAHEKWETSWTQALVRAKFTTPSLVMTAVTGPNETWFMSGYGDMAAYEADMKRKPRRQ